jgi:hypothetical protein
MFNGVLKFAGAIKIQGFDSVARCKSRDCGYHGSYSSTVKLSSRRHLHGVYTYYVKGHHVSY